MLDIIIVNWNAGEQLRDCVASVLAHRGDTVACVIVVDNGSTDGSADAIADWEGVQVIRAGENLGFATACNRGAREATSPYLLFLNPDTRVEVGSFSAPLSFMEQPENAKVGVCGIQLVDEHGRVSRTCARFPTLGRLTAGALGLDKLPGLRGAAIHMTDWNHAETRTVDHVMGAFFLVRRELFERLGGFDARFFVYLEDVDLSLRAFQAGWRSVYLAEARAFHAGGGTSRQVKAHRLFYSLRSRLLYGFKHFPIWKAWLLVLVTCGVEPFTRVTYSIACRDWTGIRNTLNAFRMLWASLPRIVQGHGRDVKQ